MRIRKNQIFPSDKGMAVNTPDELCNPQKLKINRLDPRATVVPAQRRDVFYYNKEDSDRIMLLNGDWDFALFSHAAPENFESDDFSLSDWDKIDVPSMWQFRGYGEPTYPNVEYPFPFAPPYILRLNPVGCYARKFNIDSISGKKILHFAGVDNAFYVYINGKFAGFSKGSRVPAEFDITSLVKTGENTIKVKVYTYSDASYLENQDMLLASGIFRDVFIISQPDCGLWDWEIITDTQSVSVKATLYKDDNVTALLTFMGETHTLTFVNGVASFTEKYENVKLWTAETPALYDLYLEIVKDGNIIETHSKRIGFVTSEIKNRQFLINGKPVLIKGINRHENNAENGRYITVKQIYDDLVLIKKNNINAIRCAHYPNNPAFYEFASELGIYVMDEGDIESHGCGVTGDQGFLNKSPKWLDAFMDRTVRMAERDKNETCIVIWSVGNEIGTGENCEACAEYLRNRKDKKPVQYHAPVRESQAFIGNGYCNINKLEHVLNEAPDNEQPLALIEYAHAMGNSPGSMQKVWDYVITHPRYAGGFVWEFRSHGKKRVNDDGTVDYLYGGDFHDDNHWSNFTLDGFCRSDGTPKPTFTELKYVYAPVYFKYENGTLHITNLMDFLSTQKLVFEAELSADGKIIEKRIINVPTIPARGEDSIKLDTDFAGVDRFLTVRVYNGDDTVALKQFKLPENGTKQDVILTPFNKQVTNVDGVITVQGDNFKIVFENGVPAYYEKNGKKYFDSPMRFTTYRAETDNDGIVKLYPRWIGSWENARLDKMELFTLKQNVEESDTKVTVTAIGMLAADHCYTGFNVESTYTVLADGLLLNDIKVQPFGDMPNPPGWGSTGSLDPLTPRLPRFGVCFKTEKSFDNVRWFGRGVEHNYTDSVSATPVGVYSLPASEMNFDYDVPQETGSRTDTRYLQLADGNNKFTVYGNDLFTFSYHPWHLDNLRKARHLSELKEDDFNYLYVDYRMRALGSFSCGPNPEKEDDFEPHDFIFSFAINGENGETPEYFLKNFGRKTQKLTEVYTRVKLEAEREIVECRNADE